MRGSGRAQGRSAGGWSFRPSAVRWAPELIDEFEYRLRAALRAGAAAGVSVSLSFGAIRRPYLRMESRDARSARWVVGSLLPAYPVGAWTARSVAGRDFLGSVLAIGREVSTPGAVPGVRRVPIDWAGPLLHAMQLSGVRGELRLELDSMGPGAASATTIGVLELPAQRLPAGWRLLPPTKSARSRDDQEALRLHESLWSLRASIVSASDRAKEWRAIARAVEVASSEPGGHRIRFVRRIRLLSDLARSMTFAESDLLRVFPSPNALLPQLEEDTPNAGPRIRFGDAGSPSVNLPVSPAEGRHTLILGETGMGKSTALLSAAVQCARDYGVILLDPIGDTADRFLDALPPSASDRIAWISPALSPIPINALAECKPVGTTPSGDRALNELVTALRRVRSARFGETPFWGPRIEETLHRVLRTALALPRATLQEAAELLDGSGMIPGGVSDGARREILALRRLATERPEEVDGARRLLAEVVRDRVLSELLCDPNAQTSIANLVEPRSITVLSGDAAIIGETSARYLLAVYLALFWSALLARPGKEKVFLFLDEAHWYFHESAAEILRTGRRENLHLWTATQGLRSLPEAAREALLTNCSDYVLFRGSPSDANEFARWIGRGWAERISALPRGTAGVLIEKGRRVEWVSVGGGFRPASSSIDHRRLARRYRFQSAGTVESPSTPPEFIPIELRPLLSRIVEAAGGADSAQPKELSVGALRNEFDPEGTLLRRLGTWLGQHGRLDASRRRADGTRWVVRGVVLARGLERGAEGPSGPSLSRKDCERSEDLPAPRQDFKVGPP